MTPAFITIIQTLLSEQGKETNDYTFCEVRVVSG
jgi:hypothetical protein